MSQSSALEGIILQIPHHRVQLGHGVGNRGARGEDYTATAGDFVHIPAFVEHIRGALGFGGGQACNVAHLGVEKQIFVCLRFVNKQPVNTQLFKVDDIIFAIHALHFFQPGLDAPFGFLQLFDGELIAQGSGQFIDSNLNVIQLLFQKPFLPFR